MNISPKYRDEEFDCDDFAISFVAKVREWNLSNNTNAGLLIGMFAFVCFHLLNIMINRQVQKMEQDTMEFIDMLQEPVK